MPLENHNLRCKIGLFHKGLLNSLSNKTLIASIRVLRPSFAFAHLYWRGAEMRFFPKVGDQSEWKHISLSGFITRACLFPKFWNVLRYYEFPCLWATAKALLSLVPKLIIKHEKKSIPFPIQIWMKKTQLCTWAIELMGWVPFHLWIVELWSTSLLLKMEEWMWSIAFL